MAFVDQTTGGRAIIEGFMPVKIALSGTVKVGDLIGYASGWKAADMNSSPKVYPELVAGQPGVSGDTITAYRQALIDFGSGCTATAGDRVYADTDAGEYVGTASNDQVFAVGVMTTAQQAFINPQNVFPNVKVPNVDIPITSGHAIVRQYKSQLSGTGTASLTGIEVAPKVLDAVAAGTISGIKVAIDLEGTSAGTVTYAQCFEANVGSDSGTVRTVTTAVCYRAINNMHGTVTNGPTALLVEQHGGNVVWESVIELVGTEANVWSDTDTGSGDTEAGYFKVIVNGNARYVLLYSDAPSG